MSFQVTFEGITGRSYSSDIAIDSVEITEGECPGISIFIEQLSQQQQKQLYQLRNN